MGNQLYGETFRRHMQEEAHDRGVRADGNFVMQSRRFNRFLEEALALTNAGSENGSDDMMASLGMPRSFQKLRRIPGKTPQVTLEEMSFRDLAGQTVINRNTGEPVGELFIERLMNPARTTPEEYATFRSRFTETGEISAVDWTMFRSITGPLLFNEVMKGMENEEFVFTKLAGTYPTTFIAGEKYPGVSPVLSADVMGYDAANAGNVQGREDLLLKRPGQSFATATMGETYLDLPATQLRGEIVNVDRTAIYSDRTGLIADSAQKIGEQLGMYKEMRGLRLLTGIDTSILYKEHYVHDPADLGSIQLDIWQSAAAANGGSYQLSTVAPTRPFPFVNDVPNNPLDTWETFKESDLMFSKVKDPNNGWPLTLSGGQDVFAPYSQRMDIPRITQAYQVYMVAQGLATGGIFGNSSVMTASPNPVNTLGRINAVTSRLLSDIMLMASGTYAAAGAGNKKDPELIWWTGNFKRAFRYMENWPVQVIQRPALSEVEFTHDIVLGYRAAERGQWYCFDPRRVQRNNYIGNAQPSNVVPGE